MPNGKPAGVRCIQLTDDHLCKIFDRPERPRVCARLQPSAEMCGEHAEHALTWLAWLEQNTSPAGI
jgi:hypothetical protein